MNTKLTTNDRAIMSRNAMDYRGKMIAHFIGQDEAREARKAEFARLVARN